MKRFFDLWHFETSKLCKARREHLLLNMGSTSSRKHELEILNMGSIFEGTWNGHLVIWDQYLSKSMKWEIGSMDQISFENIKGF